MKEAPHTKSRITRGKLRTRDYSARLRRKLTATKISHRTEEEPVSAQRDASHHKAPSLVKASTLDSHSAGSMEAFMEPGLWRILGSGPYSWICST